MTLIQAEHLQVVGQLLRCEAIDAALTRRNIVVAGGLINVGAAVTPLTADEEIA